MLMPLATLGRRFRQASLPGGVVLDRSSQEPIAALAKPGPCRRAWERRTARAVRARAVRQLGYCGCWVSSNVW
jgi:hypothetical protein